MAVLVTAIHAFLFAGRKAWMAGTRLWPARHDTFKIGFTRPTLCRAKKKAGVMPRLFALSMVRPVSFDQILFPWPRPSSDRGARTLTAEVEISNLLPSASFTASST